MAVPTAPDLAGSGRVDMLTRPAAAARAVVATGAYFYPSAGGFKKKKKKKTIAPGNMCTNDSTRVDEGRKGRLLLIAKQQLSCAS